MTAPVSDPLRDSIHALAEGRLPDPATLTGAFEALLSGEAPAERVAAFLMGLRVVGETAEVLVAGARVMRGHARRVAIGDVPLLDTCGTGGLSWVSLNTSTAAALVVAACGGHVAKHGNRSVPPKTGSADVLEALGVRLEIDAEIFRRCVTEAGVGFLFARSHHSAMRHVAPIRQSLGIRTVFNLLGPLTNPAGATRQLLGVFAPEWVEPMALALRDLGTERAWVVHGLDGIDEIAISGPTLVAEVRGGEVRLFEIEPAMAGLDPHPFSALSGGTVADNAQAIRDLFDAKPGPFRDMVCLNAAAGLLLLGTVSDLRTGVLAAGQALDSGAARATLGRLAAISHGRDPA